jgi:hypothetical protein
LGNHGKSTYQFEQEDLCGSYQTTSSYTPGSPKKTFVGEGEKPVTDQREKGRLTRATTRFERAE